MITLLYEMIYIWVVAAGLLSAFMPLLGYEKAGVLMVILTAFTASVPALFKKCGWMGRLVILGVLLTMVLAGVLLRQNDAVQAFFLLHTEWLPVLIIAAAAFLTGEISEHIRPAGIILSAVFAGSIIAEVILGITPEKLLVTAVLMYILLTCIDCIQRSWKREGYTDADRHLVFVMPFVILVMVPVLLLPAPDEPYDWALFKRIYKSVSESIRDIARHFSSDGVYDPTNVMIGFSGRGELHGDVRHGNDEVMELVDLSSAITGVRLSGRTFDTFEGMEWKDNDDSSGYDEILDTVAFVATVEANTENPDDYMRRHSFRISYKGITSPYVFAPVKSLVGSDGAFQSAGYLGGDVLWKDEDNIPEQYWIAYYRMNTRNPVFEGLIESAGIPDRDAFDEAVNDMSLDVSEGLTYDDYLEYRDRVYELYTGAPEISGELQSLLDSLYEGADTDTEKMNRLCRMLSGFEYTDFPGEFPEYVNDAGSLLDHFILETRRGYCSYFATAFVLLARAEGLPARYVQGYLTETSGLRNVTVYTYMAHAWPEVYYDGIGWVPYEPTPGMGTYSYWRTQEEVLALGQGATAQYPGAEPEEDMSQAEMQIHEIEGKKGPVIPVRAIVIPLAAGAGFIILFFLIGNMISAIAFRRKDIAERYGILCRQDMNLLRLLGYQPDAGETLTEFSARIGEDAGPGGTVFIDDMTDYLYAENTELEGPEKRAFEYRGELLKRLRRANIIKFIGFCLGVGLRKTK